MFDIGFLELLVIALITLVVMGPERLPEAIRAISLWIGRLKQIWSKTRQEIENEVGLDDIRHQLHNEEVLRDLGEQKEQLEQSIAQPDKEPTND
ncbi:MAG: Sec-independent protein translocase protein TatB [Porticoccaceae bacterium]